MFWSDVTEEAIFSAHIDEGQVIVFPKNQLIMSRSRFNYKAIIKIQLRKANNGGFDLIAFIV